MDYNTAIAPAIRHVLQAVGGALVTYGYIDAGMTEAFIGVGLNLGALAWWYFSRRPSPPDPMQTIQ